MAQAIGNKEVERGVRFQDVASGTPMAGIGRDVAESGTAALGGERRRKADLP